MTKHQVFGTLIAAALTLSPVLVASAQAQEGHMMRHEMHREMRHRMMHHMMRHEMHREMRHRMMRHEMHREMRHRMMHNM